MPPVVSASLRPSWPILKEYISSVSNFQLDDTSLAKAAFDLPEFIFKFKLDYIGILIFGLVIGSFVIWLRNQIGRRRIKIEAIRSKRQRIQTGLRGMRPHHIGGSDELQRKITGLEVEGEPEAQIDWEIRPDPLYIRTEEEEAKHSRPTRHNSDRFHWNRERSIRHNSDPFRQNAKRSTRHNSIERAQIIHIKRKPEFPLIQSGNSRSERILSHANPDPERRQNEVIYPSRKELRRVTTTSKAYPLDSQNGWGYFNTSGYMDESGEPHIWKSRRSGERMSSYQAISKSRNQSVRYSSYDKGYDTNQSGESSRYSSDVFLQRKEMANQYERPASVMSQSSASGSSEKCSRIIPYEPISPRENPSIQNQVEMRSLTEGPSTRNQLRSISFAPFTAPKTPPSKIPTSTGFTNTQVPQARYTPTRRIPTFKKSTGIESPTSPISPTSTKSPTGARKTHSFVRDAIGRATETSPLLGYRKGDSHKSSDSVKTVINHRHRDV